VEYDNKYLHNQLKQLTAEYNSLKMQRDREMEEHKQQCFDSRMTMEDILRKEIKALDQNYRERAVTLLIINITT
jgi:hypothetical protein